MSGEPSWYRRRGYPHFDRPTNVVDAIKLATNPSAVAKHGFLPFLHFQIVSRRHDRSAKSFVDKPRDIRYASHRDAHIYSYYSQTLAQAYELELTKRGIHDVPIAYRKLNRRCNVHFASEAFDAVKSRGDAIVIAADVSDFFGSMDHSILKRLWSDLLGVKRLPPDHYAVYRSITRYSYIDQEQVRIVLGISKSKMERWKGPYCDIQTFRNVVRKKCSIVTNSTSAGIPQGSSISALLSNLYMLDFDTIVAKEAASRGAYYRRYSDDLLLVCKPVDAKHFREFLKTQLQSVLLKPNSKKEQLSRFYMRDGELLVRSQSHNSTWRRGKPLQYLGFEFDGKRTLMRSATLSRQKQRIKGAIRNAGRAARKSGSNRIYRRTIYSRFSKLRNRSTASRTSGRKKGNFHKYIERSEDVFGKGAFRKQFRTHWTWLNKQIKEEESGL